MTVLLDNRTEQVSAAQNVRPGLDPSLASREFLELIPRDFARQHLVISQGRETRDGKVFERLAIAADDGPYDPAVVFNIGVLLRVAPQTYTAGSEAIAHCIDEAYGNTALSIRDVDLGETEAIETNVDALLVQADRDLLSTEGKAPLIKLIDAILFEALSQSASDVHIQPLADRTLVRYRLDGVLHSVRELPAQVTSAMVSRVKVMGKMDIAERRIPQDGRASVTIGERSIDLRISTLPTSYGERVVVRLLDNSNHESDLDLVAGLGMPTDVADAYLDRASRANGLILLTGPTGSGKTTTLYSTLRRIGLTSGGLNIMTIEDPIEYELSTSAQGAEFPSGGAVISQSQVNVKKGITFATGLRHILRQDPDVVMVGEIRDVETARIAVQSSLTGHLVFSTLHTNDSASAITRLVDLGIESYLVSASLSAVLAQRLVRKFHSDCNGQGCGACLGTGFKGRTGLFELLVIDDRIRDLISAQAPLSDIRAAARRTGMQTLGEDGERLIRLGLTSQVEVRRVVQGAI